MTHTKCKEREIRLPEKQRILEWFQDKSLASHWSLNTDKDNLDSAKL